MNTKICSTCKIEKAIDKFEWHSNGRKRGQCRECRANNRKAHYQANKGRILKNRKEYREDNREHILSYHREYNKAHYQNLSPLDRSIHNMTTGLLRRTGPKGEYTEKGISNRLGNRPKIDQYLRDNFADDIQKLLENREVPSIDRIDPDGHYEHGNVRVISRSENSKRARRGNTNE